MTNEVWAYLLAHWPQVTAAAAGAVVIIWAMTHWIAEPGGVVSVFWGLIKYRKAKRANRSNSEV